MKTNFTWGDDIIDSREIISRYDDLNDEYTSLVDALEEAQSELRFLNNSDESPLKEIEDAQLEADNAQEALDEFNQSFDKDELDTLTEVVKQGEEASDWSYGEGLIHESYFTQYTEDLIKDCYEMPKEFESGNWPWNHMSIDYEAAAEQLKDDYSEITVDGHTYYIRS